MKTIVRINEEKDFGYEVVIIGDDKREEILDILDIVDEGKTLKLPENPSNRKFLSIRKIKENGGEIELTYKETIHLDKTRSRKSLEEYLTDDEKIIIENLMNKAKIRKEEEENKPKSPREKLEEKIRKLTEKLNSLE